jgi:hypothetical protein
MAVSEDVLRLVRTVERLPREDQDKILRMVDLLTLVPLPVQDRTQRMLRELLERHPDTKRECVAGRCRCIKRYQGHTFTTDLGLRGIALHEDHRCSNVCRWESAPPFWRTVLDIPEADHRPSGCGLW